MLQRYGRYYNVAVEHATPQLRHGILCLTHAVLHDERVPRDATLYVGVVTAAEMRDISWRTRRCYDVTDVLTLADTTTTTLTPDALTRRVHALLFAHADNDDNAIRSKDTSHCVCVEDTAASARRLSPYMIRDDDSHARRAAQLDLGSIYVCVEHMWARCHTRPTCNLPFIDYLHVAYVHALLHAVGYRHDTACELRRMVLREQRLGQQLRAQRRCHPDTLPPLDGVEYMRSARSACATAAASLL